MSDAPAITGLGALGRLGHAVADHRAALTSAPAAFPRLGDLGELPPRFDDTPAAWISPRRLLAHRKWSPASMAARHVAREAVADAGWSVADCREAAVFFGTSRGGLSGWLTPWPGRRPLPLMRASNSLPGEPAAAVTDAFGCGLAWQIHASGCTAGLDALEHAALSLAAGKCRRALVVAVDLPLVEPLLDAYQATGILAAPDRPGMIAAEGAAALCLEVASGPHPRLAASHSALEPGALLGTADALPALIGLLRAATRQSGAPQLCAPHDSGTARHARAEPDALRDALGSSAATFSFKPYLGHTVSAAGLLETVLLADWLRHPQSAPVPLDARRPIFKIASALGGKHHLAILQPAPARP